MSDLKITAGILAHVDAGKTTLSEAIMYRAGEIRALGRVDYKNSFLDTDTVERERGITIFSKQARLAWKNMQLTLLDTPGHVDFAAEAERTFFVLDVCILVISGPSGVQAHTKTLWKLLREYNIPTFIFVNKMDQSGADKEKILSEIRSNLSDNCHEYGQFEDIAMASETAMDEYLESESLSDETIGQMIRNRELFLCYFGSALNLQGVDELLDSIDRFMRQKPESSAFGAKVYKIEKFGSDSRLTHIKVTGGNLQVKDKLPNGEKVDQIRLYSGAKFEQVNQVGPGTVCTLVGPKETYVGQGLGEESDLLKYSLVPVLNYSIIFKDNTDPLKAYESIKDLAEEDPALHISWDEKNSQIRMQLMGQVQTEIIKRRVIDTLGLDIDFSEGSILYKETIRNTVEGVGHFEPLRHYAEVHLLMEPAEKGTGITVVSNLNVDELDLNWQRLITTHVMEREHVGALTGSPLTDVKFTIVAGRAHLKHTEGGDFREATYRAIRQGLMEAENILLEPYFDFELNIPSEYVGKAMNDLQNMSAEFDAPETINDISTIKGKAPASTIQNYQSVVMAYSKGLGQLILNFAGYDICHNSDEIISEINYDSESDIDNPAGSVFCSHGAGIYVPWNEVKSNCHLPCLQEKDAPGEELFSFAKPAKEFRHGVDEWLTPDEIDSILNRATHSNFGKNAKKAWHHASVQPRRTEGEYVYKEAKKAPTKEKYLLVDGYNLIYSWPELKEVLEVNLDGARGKLLDILCNYQAISGFNVIAVFDAYRVKGHDTEISEYLNIHQVFTKEAETADAYIEKFTHEHGKKYDITVVTSDGLEQIIIRGAGCKLLSSRDFIAEVDRASKELREQFNIRE